MVRYPKDVAVIWLVMVVIILVLALAQKPRSSKNRRFETAILRKLFPVFGAYLLLLLLLPETMGVGKFPQQIRLMVTIRLVEFIAAFAILGYVTAEMRGRKDVSSLKGLTLGVMLSALLIIITHLIKGVDLFIWKKIYLSLPLITASLYGGILYRIQLAAFKRG